MTNLIDADDWLTVRTLQFDHGRSFFLPIMSPLLEANIPAVATTVFVCAICYFVFIKTDPYADIPAIGYTNFLLSYIDAVRYLLQGPKVLQEGYNKYSKNVGVFRVPTISSWQVFVCGDQLIEEIRSLRGNEEMSAEVAGRVMVSGDYTVGTQVYENPYHRKILRTRLTKNLDTWFEPLKAEIVAAFDDLMPSKKDWTSVILFQTCTHLVARSANRVIISDPNIYRDQKYIKLVTGFTLDAALGAFILGLFPKPLKGLATRFLTNIPRAKASATETFRETVAERQAKLDEHGRDYPDRPHDILSLLMDEAEGDERTVESLANRILTVNFASIHTSSMTLSSILQDLADRPEYIKPLREEAESVFSKDGFTKASLARLHKLESFMMESQRVKTSRAITSNRWCMKGYVLSNGVRIPKNTMVAVPMRSRHYDSTVFPNPNKFDGFRFYKTDDDRRGGDDNNDNDNTSRSLYLTSANSPFLLFGMGEHVCPGRFFAATILKIAIVHFLLNYDAQLDPAHFPRDSWIGPELLPDYTVALLVRERKQDG